MPNFEFDPLFARVCIWLTFIDLMVVAICFPLIVFLLFRFLENLAEQRANAFRNENKIADELEKLRADLKSGR